MSGSHPWIWGPIGRQAGLRLPPAVAPRRGLPVCTGPNSQFYKRKNPNRKPAYIFCLSLSNLEVDCLDAGSQRSARCEPLLSLKLREKRVIKKRAEKPLFITAIQAIDKVEKGADYSLNRRASKCA